MTYATRTGLETRYGALEVAQRESALEAGALDRALVDADAEADSYLGGRYSVPISPVPDNLARVACQIARYRLLGESESERARQDYDDAIRFLRDVRAGRADLLDVSPKVGADGTAAVSFANGRARVFGGGAA